MASRCIKKGHIRKRNRCNTCDLISTRKWRDANRQHVRDACKRWRVENPKRYKELKRDEHLRRNFGISLAQFLLMKRKQNHKCRLCLKQPSRTLAVDHKHGTTKVRGLLCDFCNRSLGFVDKIGLKRIARYLRG